MAERLMTPSKITAWLECAHFLSLAQSGRRGRASARAHAAWVHWPTCWSRRVRPTNATASHDFENQGRSVYQVPGRNPDETFAQWVARDRQSDGATGTTSSTRCRSSHEGIRGIADFLVRVEDR